MKVNRRTFLKNSLQSTAGLMLAPAFLGSALWGQGSGLANKIKISLQCYSFGPELLTGKFDILDFPRRVREDFDLGGAEYWNIPMMAKRKNPQFLQEIQKRTADYGLENTLMLVDLINLKDRSKTLSLCGKDSAKRALAVEAHKEWIDVAKTIGCSAIRVNLRSQEMTADEVSKVSEESLLKLLEYSSERNLSIVIENHGGYTSDAQWLVALMQKINHPNLGTLPDFGTSNFCVEKTPIKEGEFFASGCLTQYDKYQGVEEMLPYAKGISAKTRDFDPEGEELETDFKRMINLIKAASFEGYMAIEYEGGMINRFGGSGKYLAPKEGILATKALIEKYL